MNSPKRTTTKKSTPHDALIKKVMENPVAAREFLEEYLPAEFREFIDLTTLKLEKESYVEDSLRKRLSDIVYSVTTQNNDQAFIYLLLEHQSESDYWISLRLWRYTLLLLGKHKKGKDKLPFVLPLVIYNGKEKYNVPQNFWQLFDNPILAKKAMTEDYRLIDLQAMSDNDIDYEKHLSFVLYVMKHI
jgi:predicted transposase/invertase (TIGR01784 family)